MSLDTQFTLWIAPVIYTLATVLITLKVSRVWPTASFSTGLASFVSLLPTGWAVSKLSSLDGHLITSCIMLNLVTFIGWVVTRFSSRYLEGEPGQMRYVLALLVTLTSVSIMAITDNFAIVLVAWFASTLGLHHLLTFYHERTAAQIVSHKKFMVSRLAEVCLVIALILIHNQADSLSFQQIASYVNQQESLTFSMQVAALLICVAVILKSALLPLHGWLIQVMEAPTPVSALLHAGVVNLGGFVLIRLAELISAVPAAQYVLVIFGGLTAVLAGLVMMTRISIKVRLAWSTCAQMGFMVMECGLGLYELAFLHLIAHSLYKAYAFLSSGDIVYNTRIKDLYHDESRASPSTILIKELIALPVTLAVAGSSLWVWNQFMNMQSLPTIALFVVSIGLAPLLWNAHSLFSRNKITGIISVIIIFQVYMVWHLLFSSFIPAYQVNSYTLASLVIIFFTGLYVIQAWLCAYPYGKVSSIFYPWAYAGFYLDERFTRFTFRIWPARHMNKIQNSTYSSTHTPSGESI